MARYEKITNLERKQKAEIERKEKRIKKFRAEVSRKAAIANKRLDRLEKSGMTSSPAYQKWLSDGGQKFSVRGKSYNEVQSELAKINSYLDSATSSITGAKKVIKEMMVNTGFKDPKFKDFKEIQKESKRFFEIASQIEQYMRTVEDRASSLGYQKIWQAINRYVQEVDSQILSSTSDIEDVSKRVIQSLKIYEEEEYGKVDLGDVKFEQWSRLSKD